MTEVEAPAARLFAAVLSDDPVEPAVEPAGQPEISPVDCEDERIVENGLVEPVRDDEFDPLRIAARIAALRPFVDPGEAVHTPRRSVSGAGLHPWIAWRLT